MMINGPEIGTLAKTLIFDIESTSLNAGFGRILCVGYGWYTPGKANDIEAKVVTIDIKTPWDDKQVVSDFIRLLEEADITVGHNADQFDIPMINTRAMANGLDVVSWPTHVDTLRIARRHLRPHSRRLDALATLFNVESSKTPITVTDWAQAAGGMEASLAKVVEHCIADIKVTAEVYELLAPLMASHPRRVLATKEDRPHSCRFCGNMTTIRKYRMTANVPKVQVQCGLCNRYDTRAMTPKERKSRGL